MTKGLDLGLPELLCLNYSLNSLSWRRASVELDHLLPLKRGGSVCQVWSLNVAANFTGPKGPGNAVLDAPN